MSVARVVGLLVKDVITTISDGTYWHPVYMKACGLCIGTKFKIHLEQSTVKGHAYEYHKYDNCCVVFANGKVIPLQDICRVLNLPLPPIEEGRFSCEELKREIAKQRLNLEEVEVVELIQ